MGALFWQLNDCWPVASWSSIDYFGRWKALQYYARRFYDDLLVSPYAHDDKVEMYVVSDKLSALSGRIHARLLDFSGNVLLEKTQDVQVPAESSAVYLTLENKEIVCRRCERAIRGRVSWSSIWKSAGNKCRGNSVFFDVTHNLELPASSKIDANLTKSADGYTLTSGFCNPGARCEYFFRRSRRSDFG